MPACSSVTRRAEEDTRSAWSRLTNQSRLVGELETQSRVADDLLLSYREQFNVGRRSLLDVLDAQNTRYNVQAQAETARMAKLYAQYRVLAASNRLIEALGVQMPAEARDEPARQVRRQSDPAGRPAGEQLPVSGHGSAAPCRADAVPNQSEPAPSYRRAASKRYEGDRC